MLLTPELIEFIQAHLSDDTDKLLLSANRFTGIDVPMAVSQILARRQIREKLPTWYNHPELVFPSRLSTEQCSSEITAAYKQRLLEGEQVCDLTGGLGIDSFYFSQQVQKVMYVERFKEYCEAARHNFNVLGADNIQVENTDAQTMAGNVITDTFYIDPARRADCNKRVFALSDCEPDILQLKPLLLEQAKRMIVKISPMADIGETLRLLPETSEVHIVAVKNECKELLFILQGNHPKSTTTTKIYTINYEIGNVPIYFDFQLYEETEASSLIATAPRKYLYEPNAAILKSGAFKLAGNRFGLEKLHRHSHLYTSDKVCPDFPGRQFQVDGVFEFSGKLLKQLGKEIPKANLTTRNFNLSVADIRKRSGIKEGGDIYLFATTIGQTPLVIKCKKA